MMNASLSLMISFIIPMLVMIIATMVSKKMINDRESNSPFECGFDPKSSARMPFSLRFFLIAVIFLIFDVEIALILPIVIILKSSNLTIWLSSTAFFILILITGLIHEWKQGALQWAE
uniref:NADH-ubiquinone oxidoreductase chain 3 n=1 Tax=Pyrgacris descampsi TaxID=1260745 RepID=M4JC67_9ORTH|nr:NADH dehydrogenase subunit 3 [Pyrgacris descampsi]AGC22341.1 NADH dehydrogenase subunit 3 [Pyrgacris descampsi]